MNEKQPSRIVFLFYRRKAWVIAPPIGTLPLALEEIALRHVRATIRGDRAQFAHTTAHCISGLSALRYVRLMIGNTGISRPLVVPDNRKSKRVQYCGIHGCIFRSFDGFLRRSRQPLIKMKLNFGLSGSCK